MDFLINVTGNKIKRQNFILILARELGCTVLHRRDKQNFLTTAHSSRVPSDDSVKLLKVEEIKITTHLHFMQKAICGVCTHKIKKKV